MNTRLTTVIALASVAAAACLIQTSGEAAPGQEPRTLHSAVQWWGSFSAVEERRIELVRDFETFESMWAEHKGAKLEHNALEYPVTPRVNFHHYMVVASFRGKSWNCNGDFIASITKTGDTMRIRFDSSTFQTVGPDGGGRAVTPYGIWVVPRHEGTIVVEENVQNMIGRDPVWKEVRRFDTAELIGG